MTTVDIDRVDAIAKIVKEMPGASPLNFYSAPSGGAGAPAANLYPKLNHPATVDFFFYSCTQNFGFWHDDTSRYDGPVYGTVGGNGLKGSSLLYAVLMRRLDEDPAAFSPAKLCVRATGPGWDDFLSDDLGSGCFLRQSDQRRSITIAYASTLLREGLSPSGIVETANVTEHPLRTFLDIVCALPGFCDDPLRKKAMLLAMMLSGRPEKFLTVTDPEHWEPVVDYHLMRVALRTGMVRLPTELAVENSSRRFCTPSTERSVRDATFVAVSELVRRSGKSHAAVDNALWQARRYCPEMETPNCEVCAMKDACAKRVDLFQPVFRTSNY